MRRTIAELTTLAACALCIAAAGGCSGEEKPSGTAAGAPKPQLTSTNPAERAAAAREAGEKYGAKP